MIIADAARLRALAERSVEVIRAHQAPTGAYLASPNFAVYRYCWLRDGAFIADAMSRAGDLDSAEGFFRWCDRVLRAREDRIAVLLARRADGEEIETSQFLPTRFTVAGDDVDDDWTDFQLDGYGTWLWALDLHHRRHGRPLEPFLAGAELSARYIARFWDHPCYDWWEEHVDRVHTSTLGALWAGLHAATEWSELGPDVRAECMAAAEAIRERILAEARRVGHLPKWLGDDALDASLIAVAVPFEVLDAEDPLMRATVAKIEAELVRDDGVYRYLGDTYYGGGQWLILAGFLGWYHARTGRTDEALAKLRWIAAQATEDGLLPEQVGHHLQAPSERGLWLRRWGPVATPLLWSHAMYLSLALEVGAVQAPVLPAQPER